MKLLTIYDPAFRKYGRVISEIDFTALVEEMGKTPCPSDRVIYEPGVEELEQLAVSQELQCKIFGEMPIQIGYCNGQNTHLNAVEYHHSSEVNVAATDAILLLGCLQDITEAYSYDTDRIEAFLLPQGSAVEMYATTLHYAPCSHEGNSFRVCVVLPKGTNLPLTHVHGETKEDRLITARNKWLIGHPDGGFTGGEHIGLIGENIDTRDIEKDF